MTRGQTGLPPYIEDARFIEEDKHPPVGRLDLDNCNFDVSVTARSRMREYDSMFTRGHARQCIHHGAPYRAKNNCTAFVLEEDGLARYAIVGTDGANSFVLVTVWAFIWNEDRLRDSGNHSSKEIARVKEVIRDNSEWFA